MNVLDAMEIIKKDKNKIYYNEDNEFIDDETEIQHEEPPSAKIEVREVGYAFEGNELED